MYRDIIIMSVLAYRSNRVCGNTINTAITKPLSAVLHSDIDIRDYIHGIGTKLLRR